MNVAAELRRRLEALAPDEVELIDDSARHVGHPGAAGGGMHFRLRIRSTRFAGKSTLERHRLVIAAVGDLMNGAIHALSVDARAPGEV